MKDDFRIPVSGLSRRHFLRETSLGSAAVAAIAQASSKAAAEGPSGKLPTIRIGKHMFSRLIVGANPINGGSHLSRFVNNQMKRYFTEERAMGFLAHCEKMGINTWQAGPQNVDYYKRHCSEEGKLQFVSLAKDKGQRDKVIEAGAIAVAHHGEVTDRLFKTGQMEVVGEFVARTRETGVLTGVSTHMPAVVDYIESKGWDLDFYMTCVYERHRTKEELKELLGYVPIPVREVYLEEDPPRMFKAIRQTEKTCFAFKILAAGRLCDRKPTVEQAFEQTFSQIKAKDAVIVGMYPEYEDQAALNADYVRRFSSLSV